jgi:deoxyadenosine/deoxycytidine kinase
VTAKLVSIIGPPAAGKTTLAALLAEDLGGSLIREDYRGNPFLAPSYTGEESARLPGQLFFLMSRLRQMARANWPAAGLVVSDYGFCQDRAFAEARLSEGDLAVYDRIARTVEPMVREPEAVICVDAEVRTLLERIRRRGRPFEQSMSEGFLRRMREIYRDLPARLRCPTIRVDADRVDFRETPARAEILAELRQILSASTNEPQEDETR